VAKDKVRMIAPQCLALVLCDAVIEDLLTRNKSLINMFNGILTQQVPVRHNKMCVFAAFSGGRGRVPISLRLCHDQDYQASLLPAELQRDIEFRPESPHAVVDIVFEVRGFVFPKFGDYTLEVLCDGVPIASRRFSVNHHPGGAPIPPPGAPPPPGEPSPPEPPTPPLS
jgi:Family of unknown function (DUF6941)